MKYFMPTKVYSEYGCIRNHGSELSSLGNCALIVTGKCSSYKNGSFDDVVSVLEHYGIRYSVFDEVEENPSVETVMKARELGLECKADFVIGIGGGSPLDAAKAAALMIANPDKGKDFLYQSLPADALPVAAVPTTCGTGSEVTGVAVITRHNLKTKVSIKHKIFPKLAMIDGKYIIGAPRPLIVNTAIDAFSHLIESGVNLNADKFSLMLVRSGLELWGRCRSYIDGSSPLDQAGAQMLMEASALGGMAIAQTGTTIPHALSYMLTYEEKIPHGPAVGAFLANYLKFSDTSTQNELLYFAGFKDIDEFDEFIKSLAPISPSRELLERSAESVLNKPEKLAVCPYKLDRETMYKLIEI